MARRPLAACALFAVNKRQFLKKSSRASTSLLLVKVYLIFYVKTTIFCHKLFYTDVSPEMV